MQWFEAVAEFVGKLQPIEINSTLLHQMLPLIDFTRLTDNDTEANVASFLDEAQQVGAIAAVCVYPQFARLAADQMRGSAIKVATVVNFPEGTEPLEEVLIAINQALQAGANEMDVVFPYQRFLAGERQYAHNFVASCKAACGASVLLKVILETGELVEPSIIAEASFEALTAGADFIKTSTGKTSTGATLEAAATMLLVIRHVTPQLKRPLGLKVSGGIREISQAAAYMQLATNIMGREWLSPETFRFGSSSLVTEMSSAGIGRRE